jgi:hypothetical protein
MYRNLAETINSFSKGLEDCHCSEDRKLISDYLAALAPLLAGAVIGDNILRELPNIDRLFGHTWIIEIKPFESAFELWQNFKEEYTEAVLSGMTVNERLYALDVMDDFDNSCNAKDEKQTRGILKQAKVDEESIQQTVDKYIKND